MTASTTPRLGLINPVDTDTFTSADFRATMGKLDAVPGVTIIANSAARTGLGWGTAQHGSIAIAADTGAQWMWSDPSGSGTWIRVNSIGVINQTTQSAVVQTTSVGTPQQFIDSGNFTIPGGRTVHIQLDMGLDNTQGFASITIVTIYNNGTKLDEFNYRIGQSINSSGTTAIAHIYTTALTTSGNNRITAGIRSANLPTSVGGAGTSVARRSTLIIHEV